MERSKWDIFVELDQEERSLGAGNSMVTAHSLMGAVMKGLGDAVEDAAVEYGGTPEELLREATKFDIYIKKI